MCWYLANLKKMTGTLECCHDGAVGIQANCTCPLILFVSVRMHSFEITSEQSDFKFLTAITNQFSFQMSEASRIYKVVIYHKLYCHWDFSDINMEPWSTFYIQLLLGWILGILQQWMPVPFTHGAPAQGSWTSAMRGFIGPALLYTPQWSAF